MKPTRRNAVAISCILLTVLTLYLTKPWFASLEGELSLGWFPLEQMTDTYGDVAQGSAGGPHFGRAYTLEVTKRNGEVKIIYLANSAGRVFGNNTRPAGRILLGCEVGDAIRVWGLMYSTIGPSPSGSRIPSGYRIMMLQSVEKLNSTWEVILQSRPVVAAFCVEMRTGRAEYLRGEESVLIIKNQGPNTVSFGSYYWLKRHQDGDWVTIPFKENVAFPAVLTILEPGNKYREKIRFSGLVEVPGEGRYRIAKELSIEEMDLTLIKYAEFYIRSNWSYKMVWDRFRIHVGITTLALITISILFVIRKR